MKAFILAFVLLITVAAYGAVWSAPYVYEDANWDTQLSSSHVRPVTSWQLPSRELTLRSYQVEASAIDAEPWHFHAINLALFAVLGGLVYVLALVLTRDARAAVMGAVVMLWHPLNTQAVSYISGRADLLMAIGVVSSVVFLLSRLDLPIRLLGFIASGLVALLSKESGVVVFLIAPWTWMLWRDSSRWVWASALSVLFLIVLVSSRLWFSLGAGGFDAAAIQATGVWRLLALWMVPVGLSIDPDPWSIALAWRLVALACVCGLASSCWVFRQRSPLMAWALGWALLSVSTRFVALSVGEPLHEHQWILANVALSVLTGVGIVHVFSSGERAYA